MGAPRYLQGLLLVAAVRAEKPLCRDRFSSRSDDWRDCRVQIGGLAIAGAEAFIRTLGPTFQDYLTTVLNATRGLEFEAKPLNFNQNFEEVGGNRIDYIYSNPAAYTCMMVEFDIATIASLMNFRKGNALDQFAGVIFSLAGSNFTTVNSLTKAKVAAVSISGLGAMQLQQAELLTQGINIMKDVEQITFTSNQGKIVQEVQNGWADVGFVRTDMIDRQVEAGNTKWEYFQVINLKDDGVAFPFRRSTNFTPEWPIGALRHVPPSVSEEVGRALMALDRFSPDPMLSEPAVEGKFATWVPPMNYFNLLSMLEDIGYYSPQSRKCLRASDVLEGVKCPAGYVKQRPEKAFCSSDKCKDGYICLCKPCEKLKDPELVLSVEPVKRTWNPNINGTAIQQKVRMASDCTRMKVCAVVARGQAVTWTLLDQIGEANRLAINAPRIHTVELLVELEGVWQALSVENITAEDGFSTQEYVLNTTFLTNGFSVVQLRINGEQAPLSPVVVEVFEPIEQQVKCPSGHMMKQDGQCSPCPRGTKGDTVKSTSTGILTPVCLPCEVGTYQDATSQSTCKRCPAGTFTDEEGLTQCKQCELGQSTKGEDGASTCEPCAAGQEGVMERAESGGMFPVCRACDPGMYAASTGQTICQMCGPGRFSSQTSSQSCSVCPAGYFAPGYNTSQCMPCPRGSYRSEGSADATRCEMCKTNKTTVEKGSRSESECECAPGTYLLHKLGCKTCENMTGLDCQGGNGLPRQVAGFWVDKVDDVDGGWELSVYRCRDVQECPGGQLRGCSEGREGRACNDCEAGRVGAANGTCELCGSTSILPFLGAGAFLIMALSSLVVMVEADRCQQSLSRLTVLMVFGQVVMAVQALGAIRQLSINWVEPVKTILDIMKLVTFDVNLLQVPCLFNSDNPLMKFALQLLAYPIFAATLLIIITVFRFFKLRKVSFDSTFNLNGILLFTLFITLTLTVLMPFQCAPNPNDTTYMTTNPGITCWSSTEHQVLVFMAVVGILLYPTAILSWTIWTTVQYPYRISTGAGLRLIQRHRFLFERFTVERYYYGVFLLVRNTLVALVPVLFVAFPVAQLVAMGCVLLGGMAGQSRLWPWRTESSNKADLGSVCCLVMVLITCAPLMQVDLNHSEKFLGWCLCTVVVGCLAFGTGTIAHGLYRRMMPLQAYDAFLCHHKAGAGSLCRFLKFSLQKFADCKVFLDSDNLEDLDLLFDIVRCNCKNLVIILSPELLKRIWCAGEIVTAHRNHVHMVPVRCDGFSPLKKGDFEQVPMYWTEEEQHLLACFGISMENVVEAYRFLVDQPYLVLQRGADQQAQERVHLEIVTSCKLKRRGLAATSTHTGTPKIAVIGAFSDFEALATCQIVETVVQRNTFAETMTIRTPEEALKVCDSLVYVVVVLQKGVLWDPLFIEVLGVLAQQPAAMHANSGGGHRESGSSREFLLVNTDPRFEFPNTELYNNLAEGEVPGGISSDLGPWLAETYRSLFCVLALPLTPQGSETLMLQQLGEVCRRFRKIDRPKERRNSREQELEEAVMKHHTSVPGSSRAVRAMKSHGSQGSSCSRGSRKDLTSPNAHHEAVTPCMTKTSSASSGVASICDVGEVQVKGGRQVSGGQASLSLYPSDEAGGDLEVGHVSSRPLRHMPIGEEEEGNTAREDLKIIARASL